MFVHKVRLVCFFVYSLLVVLWLFVSISVGDCLDRHVSVK